MTLGEEDGQVLDPTTGNSIEETIPELDPEDIKPPHNTPPDPKPPESWEDIARRHFSKTELNFLNLLNPKERRYFLYKILKQKGLI